MESFKPAELQVTAESILQEAYESKTPLNRQTLETKLENLEEIEEFQKRKRIEFEKHLRKDYHNAKHWLQYVNFEVSQHEIVRARSLFERSLEYNKENVQLWIRYVQMELKNQSINHARNLLERAIRILPFVEKFWWYYIQLEESLGNLKLVRNIFNRWLLYEPRLEIFDNFINMEKRNGNDYENIYKVFEKYLIVYPNFKTWLKLIHYEVESKNNTNVIRKIYTIGIDTLIKLKYFNDVELLLCSWIKFESNYDEFDRCKSLFKFGFEKLSKESSKKLFSDYLIYEKKFNDGSNNLIILQKRKSIYESDLTKDPNDYDKWWIYILLMEELINDKNQLIEIYEKVLLNQIPDSEIKNNNWKKYIMIWIKYLFFMELEINNIIKTRELYEYLIFKILIPRKISFSKIWINFSKFEIRQNDLIKGRKILGQAIGIINKPKIYKYYIKFEKSLKEVDRVRKLYEIFLMKFPNFLNIWFEYLKFENSLGEFDRVREIFEILINENLLNNHLIVWYKYIEFLINDLFNFNEARNLYERLIDKNKKNVKIWIKFALFEVNCPNDEQLEILLNNEEEEEEEEVEIEIKPTIESIENSREVFEKGIKYFKLENLVDERVLLFEAFKEFEEIYGNEESLSNINRRLPTLIKKINDNNEEIFEYKFPDDEETNNSMMKFLLNAQKWKLNKQ